MHRPAPLFSLPARSLLLGLMMCLAVGITACGDDDDSTEIVPAEPFVVTTFNTGTSESIANANDPEDGYTEEQAVLSDEYYGDGLAWMPAIEATREYLADLQPDIIAFQEIFDPNECPDIPAEAHAGFICETWQPGDPVVAQMVLGDGYQIATHLGKTDKTLAVKKSFGRILGCEGDYCVDGLDGFQVDGCGSGSRVGRAIIERTNGERITVVSYHGTSGLNEDDRQCRLRQIEQIFVDFGDGAPAANGSANIILGDLNTDPGRADFLDPSAARWQSFVGEGLPFRFLTEVGFDATGTYGPLNIDHIVSDVFDGNQSLSGIGTDLHPVWPVPYFDHRPITVLDVGAAP